MATEDQNIKITFDTNAGKAAIESNKLASALDNVEDSGTSASKTMHDLDATFDDVYKGMKPLTAMLGEAEDRLYQLGIQGVKTGDEYEGLLRKVAEYRKIQIETDRTVDAAATTLGQKLAGGAQIAATGIQGVTSGMALFGNQSEDTEKALLKVQAAMAFADSIANISTLGGQFRVFKDTVVGAYTAIIARKQADVVVTNEATAAQNRLNISVLKNPYVLAAAAIAALVVGVYAWVKANGEAAKREEEVKESVNSTKIATDNLAESIENANKVTSSSNDIEVLRARAYGATDEQIQKLIKSQKELAVSTSLTQSKQAYDNLLKANSDYWKAVKTGNQDLIDSAKENQQAAKELYKSSNEDFTNAINEDIKFRLQTQIDANAKAKDAQDKADDEAKKKREKQRDKDKEAAELAKKDREEDAAALLDFQAKIANSDQERAVEERTQKVENLKELNKEIGEVEQERFEAQKELSEREIQLEKDKADQKQAIEDSQLKAADSAVGFLQAIAGKNKFLQKTAIIAESALGIGKSVIANNTANVGALATPQAIATSGAAAAPVIAFNNISTGLGIAANIAATAKALQAVGGGGGASAGSAAGGTRSAPPPSVAFNNSAENQIGQSISRTQAEQPPIKVNVLESDITKAQNNVNVLVKKNEF